MGRFLNADTLVGETGALLSHNMFAYCNNNPVNNEDQDGDVAWWVGAAIGGAVWDSASYALSHRKGGFSWKGLGKAAAKGAVTGVLMAGAGKALKLVKVAKASTKSTKILKSAKKAKIIRKSSPKVTMKGSSKGTSKAIDVLAPMYKNVELGRGSTGRKVANTLKEQLAMKQVLSNPLNGAKWRKEVVMCDTKHGWLAKDGWKKISNNINGVEIHFVYNKVTGAFDDFKFK